jgi:putative transposase
MHDRLCEQWRSRMGRTDTLTPAVIDAQSNRSSPQGGESGFDADKKVKGRKRNHIVDTMDLVIALKVTARACRTGMPPPQSSRKPVSKRPGSKALHRPCLWRRVCSRHRVAAPDPCRSRLASREQHNRNLAQRSPRSRPRRRINKGFVALPQRSVVQRTHAWTERWRRTTANWIFRPPGFGWPRPECYSTD